MRVLVVLFSVAIALASGAQVLVAVLLGPVLIYGSSEVLMVWLWFAFFVAIPAAILDVILVYKFLSQVLSRLLAICGVVARHRGAQEDGLVSVAIRCPAGCVRSHASRLGARAQATERRSTHLARNCEYQSQSGSRRGVQVGFRAAGAQPLHRADVPKAASRPLARRSCRTLGPSW